MHPQVCVTQPIILCHSWSFSYFAPHPSSSYLLPGRFQTLYRCTSALSKGHGIILTIQVLKRPHT